MAAMDKFTWTMSPVEEKGLQGHSLKRRTPPLALTGFYCLSGHITLRMVLIYYAQVCFRQLQKTQEKMLLITSKRKDICKCKGKRVELVTLVLGRFSIDFRKLL